MFKTLTQDMGAYSSYKAISPGEPLGLTGFDVGVEAGLTNIESGATLQKAVSSSVALNYLPSAKLHAHKGLPFGIDIGAVYMPEINVSGFKIGYMGGELRYAILGGGMALPALAVRGAYTKMTGFPGIDVSNKSIELAVSKGFLMLKPYAGIGMVWTTGTPTGVMGSVFKEENVSLMKYNAGLNLNLGLMNFAFDWDMTGKDNTYSAKVGFRW